MSASPFTELSRANWARLADDVALPLTADELDHLRGLGDPVDLDEVREVYLPLAQLLTLHIRAQATLSRDTEDFLRVPVTRTPFVIGIAGSVAVGKSTTARLLQLLLARTPEHPRVALVTTDGFLLPNEELRRRGLLARKGFPESYDRRALLAFLLEVKAGADVVHAPVYSHLTYDVVPGQQVRLERPDVVIVEGLNVLQPPRLRPDASSHLAVSDFFDFSVYVDADTADIRRWYVERFLALRQTAFQDPSSYFHRYAGLTEAQAMSQAEQLWDAINGPNLVLNILPTRGRATLVLHKGPDHAVARARLRKR